jgi:hypothetical protein
MKGIDSALVVFRIPVAFRMTEALAHMCEEFKGP